MNFYLHQEILTDSSVLAEQTWHLSSSENLQGIYKLGNIDKYISIIIETHNLSF